jgi:hypothetical protein
MGIPKKHLRRAKRLPKGPERDNGIKGSHFMKTALINNSLRGITMCAGDRVPMNMAQGLVDISNWRLIRGIKKIKRKIIVPKLPKEVADG